MGTLNGNQPRKWRIDMAAALRAVIHLAMIAQYSDDEIVACLRGLIDDIRRNKFCSIL
jgi:hypothetical protein